MYGTIFGRMPGFKPKLLLKAARCATIELPSAGEYKVELFIC